MGRVIIYAGENRQQTCLTCLQKTVQVVLARGCGINKVRNSQARLKVNKDEMADIKQNQAQEKEEIAGNTGKIAENCRKMVRNSKKIGCYILQLDRSNCRSIKLQKKTDRIYLTLNVKNV